MNGSDGVAKVFCDQLKAFNRLYHEILLQKLQCYGFRGVSYQWIKTYFRERRKIVKCTESTEVVYHKVLLSFGFYSYFMLMLIESRGKFTLFVDDRTII